MGGNTSTVPSLPWHRQVQLQEPGTGSQWSGSRMGRLRAGSGAPLPLKSCQWQYGSRRTSSAIADRFQGEMEKYHTAKSKRYRRKALTSLCNHASFVRIKVRAESCCLTTSHSGKCSGTDIFHWLPVAGTRERLQHHVSTAAPPTNAAAVMEGCCDAKATRSQDMSKSPWKGKGSQDIAEGSSELLSVH